MNNLINPKIFDWISLSVFALMCYPFIHCIIFKDVTYAWMALGIIVVHFITAGLKILTSRYSDHPMFKRPHKADGCNMFCQGGDVSRNPGFPSGHVAHATFFVTFIIFININDYFLDTIGVIYILLVGLARYMKNCHNLEQVIAGILNGFILGSLWAFLYTLIAL